MKLSIRYISCIPRTETDDVKLFNNVKNVVVSRNNHLSKLIDHSSLSLARWSLAEREGEKNNRSGMERKHMLKKILIQWSFTIPSTVAFLGAS